MAVPAKGALTRKYKPDELLEFGDVRRIDPLFYPDNFLKIYELVKVLEEVAGRYGKTPAQAALNWLLMNSPAVIPIPGAAGWRLSYDDWRLIDEASRKLRLTNVVW